MKKSVPIGTNTLNDNTVHEIIDILIKINAEEVLFALIRLDEIDKYCSIVKKYKPYFEEKKHQNSSMDRYIIRSEIR